MYQKEVVYITGFRYTFTWDNQFVRLFLPIQFFQSL